MQYVLKVDNFKNFNIIKEKEIFMKIFNKIKQHIFDKFKEYGLLKEIIPPYKTPVQLYNIDHSDKNFDQNAIRDFATELLSTKNFYSSDKNLVLEKIYNDCVKLNKCLEPLKSMGISYRIELFGGAVRDYLLGEHNNIKDLDFLISLLPTRPWNSDSYWIEQEQNKVFIKENFNNHFTEDELDAVNFDDNDKLYIKHNKIAQIYLSRSAEVTHTNFFEPSNRIIKKNMYGENILQALSGLMKVNKGDFNYELDLLLTDKPTQYFMNCIDFDICNLKITLIDTNSHGYHYIPNIESLSQRFYGSFQFFNDVMNKTITFNVNDLITCQQIEHSLGSHRERLIKKYPDYKLQVSNKHCSEKEQKIIEKMMLCHELGESLESSQNEPIVKNKKIKL
jgi:hypothetical protein